MSDVSKPDHIGLSRKGWHKSRISPLITEYKLPNSMTTKAVRFEAFRQLHYDSTNVARNLFAHHGLSKMIKKS